MSELDDAIQSIKKGKLDEGRQLLNEIYNKNNRETDERFWLWYSITVPNDESRKKYLGNAKKVTGDKSILAEKGLNALESKTFDPRKFMKDIIDWENKDTIGWKNKRFFRWTAIAFLFVLILCYLAVNNLLSNSSTSAVIPLKLEKSKEQFTIYFAGFQILAMMIILLTFTIAGLVNRESRKQVYEDLVKLFSIKVELPSFAGWLVGIILTLLCISGFLAYLFFNSLPFASLIGLIVWWVVGPALYPKNSKHNQSFLLLILYIFVAWSSFIIFWSYKGTGWGTLIVYIVCILFLIGTYLVSKEIVGVRLADDLYLIIVLFTSYVFVNTLRSPQESASATVLGLIVNFIQQSSNHGIITDTLVFALTNNMIAEYYFVSINFLLLLLGQSQGISQLSRKIPARLLRITINILGIILVVLAIRQALIAFYLYDQNNHGNILIISTSINLMIALIGIFVLFFTNTTQGVDEVIDHIHINAQPDEIIKTLLDVQSAPEWSPGLEQVSNLQRGGQAVCTYDYKYKVGKEIIDGKTIITEATLPRFVMKTTGKPRRMPIITISSTWNWIITPNSGGTTVKITVNYPSWLVEKSTIVNQTKQTLENFKNRLENKG